jgi:hypothetical protein
MVTIIAITGSGMQLVTPVNYSDFAAGNYSNF